MIFGYDKFISEFCKIKVIIQVLDNYKPSQNKDFGSRSPAKTQRDKKAEPSFNPQAYSSMSRI